MTTPTDAFDNTPTDWDVTVLDIPVVLDIPDQLPDHPDPLLITAVQALVSSLLNEPTGSEQVGHLARNGIVALRTSSGCLELHETLLGWTLKRSWGTPDPTDLATAARLRAHRLAGERRRGCGGPA